MIRRFIDRWQRRRARRIAAQLGMARYVDLKPRLIALHMREANWRK